MTTKKYFLQPSFYSTISDHKHKFAKSNVWIFWFHYFFVMNLCERFVYYNFAHIYVHLRSTEILSVSYCKQHYLFLAGAAIDHSHIHGKGCNADHSFVSECETWLWEEDFRTSSDKQSSEDNNSSPSHIHFYQYLDVTDKGYAPLYKYACLLLTCRWDTIRGIQWKINGSYYIRSLLQKPMTS